VFGGSAALLTRPLFVGDAMATACKFNPSQLSFAGSPVEQARCLLRFVRRAGEVGDAPATLPQLLENLLADAQDLGITSARP
jgi:hypothetical protein